MPSPVDARSAAPGANLQEVSAFQVVGVVRLAASALPTSDRPSQTMYGSFGTALITTQETCVLREVPILKESRRTRLKYSTLRLPQMCGLAMAAARTRTLNAEVHLNTGTHFHSCGFWSPHEALPCPAWLAEAVKLLGAEPCVRVPLPRPLVPGGAARNSTQTLLHTVYSASGPPYHSHVVAAQRRLITHMSWRPSGPSP